MAYAVFQMTVTDEAGNVVPLASVEVRSHTTGQPLAQLFSDRAGTTPLGNPVTADADGFIRFYTVGKAYQIIATKDTFSRQWNHVAIGTAAEYDVDDLEGFDTLTEVAATAIEADGRNFFSVGGGVALGDGDGGFYARVASEPTRAAKVQSDDGAWWELFGINVAKLGIAGTTSGIARIVAGAVLGAVTFNLPAIAATDTFAVIGAAQTLSNKTLVAPLIDTCSFTTNSNPVFRHLPTNHINESTNTTFALVHSVFPFANGPVGEVNYDDEVWAFGINVATPGTRLDTSKPALYEQWENKFYQSGMFAVERHIEYKDAAGVAHRMFTMAANHDGTSTGFNGFAFAGDRYIFADWAGVEKCSIYTYLNRQVFSSGFAIQKATNNQVVIEQYNAAGNAYYALPYLNASDQLEIGNTMHFAGDFGDGLPIISWTAGGPTNTAYLANIDVSAATGLYNLMRNKQAGVAAGAHCGYIARVASANLGDPLTQYDIEGVQTWTTGVDNSDSDKFKVSASAALGTTDWLAITTAGAVTLPGTLTIGAGSAITSSGAGGALGTNAFSSTAFLPLAGGTLTGALLFTDNTLDIGASAATRPRTGYFGTSIISSPIAISADITATSGAAPIQCAANNSINSNSVFVAYGATALGAVFSFYKTRAVTTAASTIVNNNDEILNIAGFGSNGGGGYRQAGSLYLKVDGVPGAGNDMPGRWEFYTTPDGSATPGLAFSIKSTKAVLAEASITAHNSTAIPVGGSAGVGLLFSSTANFGKFFGSGAPTLAAAKGSTYARSDGSGTNDRMYVNTDGGTTWTAVVTVA